MSDTVEPYKKKMFDPACTQWTTFSELQVGDMIDYWGCARPVVEHDRFDGGRVRIMVSNEHGGHDVAAGPGDEGVWRMPREGERPPV